MPYRASPAAKPPAAPATACELPDFAALAVEDEVVDWKRARAGYGVRPTRAERAIVVRAVVDLAAFIVSRVILEECSGMKGRR